MNEQEKHKIIKEIVDYNDNKNRTSKKINVYGKQIDRLIIKYKEKGKSDLYMATAQRNQQIP